MTMHRRTVVKAMLACSALVGLGAVIPGAAFAARNKDAFSSDDQVKAMQALFDVEPANSTDIVLKAPSIAENGAVVPVTVSTEMANVESISIFVADNPTPLVAEFMIPAGTQASVATRIRMGKTSTITAVVKADGKLFSTARETKVTIGGCGG